MEQSTVRRAALAQQAPAERSDIARAIRALSAADRRRLEAIARLRARAMPGGLGWADLLHEAIRRALDGARRWPHGVPLVAFLAGIMRSVWSEQRRRPSPEALPAALEDEVVDAAPGPERIVAAAQAVGAIYRLFAGDAPALAVLAGLAEGLPAAQIRTASGLSETEYDSTRRRMRRALLRAGLVEAAP